MNRDYLQSQLDICYSAQAEHFSHTRKKQRPELAHIKTYIHEQHEQQKKKQVVSVELGCGTARMLPLLEHIYEDRLEYTGVDSAAGMIEQAKKQHGGTILSTQKRPKSTAKKRWIIGHMLDVLEELPDHSVDYVVLLASLQHIMTDQERQKVFHQCYRVLQYNGSIIATNWSYSKRFLKTYRQAQVKAWGRSLWNKDRSWHDLLIPRKDPHWQKNNHIRQRYYHIYTLHELNMLSSMSGFVIERLGYICQDGSFHRTNRWKSRNSLLIAKKSIHHTSLLE